MAGYELSSENEIKLGIEGCLLAGAVVVAAATSFVGVAKGMGVSSALENKPCDQKMRDEFKENKILMLMIKKEALEVSAEKCVSVASQPKSANSI